MQRRATAGERAAARVVHTGSGSVFHSSYHRFVWSVPFIVSYLYIRAVALFSAHPSPVRLVRFVHSDVMFAPPRPTFCVTRAWLPEGLFVCLFIGALGRVDCGGHFAPIT